MKLQSQTTNKIDQFRALLNRSSPIKEAYESFLRIEAPEYNILKVFRLERHERIHSLFLANLLDPCGTHGQGDLFLRSFLQRCHSEHPGFPDLVSMLACSPKLPRVDTEVPTGLGRPDLLILLDRKFALIIENKIDAPEGKDQLKRYRAWLGKQREAKDGSIALVYLTLHPLTSGNTLPDKCFSFSYKEDIAKWIRSCLGKGLVGSSRVRYSLIQYLHTVGTLCGEEIMDKSKDPNRLGEFVRANKSDIVELWEALKRELGDPRRVFWQVLLEKVREGLPSPEMRLWTAEFDEDDEKLSITEGNSEPELSAGFVVQEHAGRLQYGIAWSKQLDRQERKRILDLSKELGSLQNDLKERDFKPHSWWVALKETPYRLDDKSTVLDLFSGSFQRLIAENMLDLFRLSCDRVHKMNEKLKRRKA